MACMVVIALDRAPARVTNKDYQFALRAISIRPLDKQKATQGSRGAIVYPLLDQYPMTPDTCPLTQLGSQVNSCCCDTFDPGAKKNHEIPAFNHSNLLVGDNFAYNGKKYGR